MAKIFIDTNIFLDFYGAKENGDINEIKKEIEKNYKYFVFPTQVMDEYLRKRCKVINGFLKDNDVRAQVINLKFVNADEDISQYNEAVKIYNKCKERVLKKVENYIEHPEKDLVYCLINDMYNSKEVEKIETITDDLIKKARIRFDIGNPPSSEGKTCCDQLIWEALLTIDDDLVIVSRDNKAYTVNNNNIFLEREFKIKTGKTLFPVYNKITDAISKVALKPDDKAVKAEKDILANIKKVQQNATIHVGSKSHELNFTDIEGNRYDLCKRCQIGYRINGSKCNNCGFYEFE